MSLISLKQIKDGVELKEQVSQINENLSNLKTGYSNLDVIIENESMYLQKIDLDSPEDENKKEIINLNNLVNNRVIDDELTKTDQTWSSEKINSELNLKVNFRYID